MLDFILRGIQIFEYTVLSAWKLATYIGYIAALIVYSVYSLLADVRDGIVILEYEFRNFIFVLSKIIETFTEAYCKFFIIVGDATKYTLEELSKTWKIFDIENVSPTFTHFVGVFNRSAHLISDTVWWLITLLPLFILTVFQKLIAILYELCFGFLIFVVLKSIYHLITTVMVFVIIYRHRVGIANYIFDKLLVTFRISRNILHKMIVWMRSIVQPSFPRRSIRRSTPDDTVSIDNSKLSEQQRCVVCRNRSKCVLLWPCKHLCLCEECSDILEEQYIFSCPLCRSKIESTMLVYM